MAKFIIEFRLIKKDENMRAIDLVQPDNFDQVIATMKKVTNYRGRSKIGNPHLLMKIGYALRTLILLAKTNYIKSKAVESVKYMDMTLSLYESDYTKFTNNAEAVYEAKKGNAPEELPLEADLKVLRMHCITEIERITLSDSFTDENYRHVNKLCFTPVLTFNARRGSEPSKLTTKHWEDTMSDKWKRKTDLESLTDPVEKKLPERLKLCYVKGKKKRKGESFLFLLFTYFTFLIPFY